MAFTACEVEFDIRGLDDDPLFLIDGYVRKDFYGEDGANSLQMYIYAVPSAAGNREFDSETRCTLRVYRNSGLVDTKDYITVDEFYGLIADSYMFSPGDEITVTAEADGFYTATASTVLPQDPPAVEASCTVSGDNLLIRFSFEDDASTEDAYAFCFRTVYSDNPPYDSQLGGYLDLSFGDSGESVFQDAGPFDVTWQDGGQYYGVFDDAFNGQRKEFEVSAPFKAVSYGTGSYYVRVQILRVSPERLRYETACRDKGTNILGFMGLAPVTFAYTNVSGGSGCFSSESSAFSPWMKIPLDDSTSDKNPTIYE